MIKFIMPLGIYDANCYILGCEETKKACVIDPGGDHGVILNTLKENGLELEVIVLTHGHVDHIGGAKALREATGAELVIHEDDASMLKEPRLNLSVGMGAGEISIEADRLIKEGERVAFGTIKLKAIHTPGHTPGSICLKVNHELFSGDTLFQRSVGRTDLAGGNHNALIQSIKKKLYSLSEETVVYPGHGPETTIGFEKKSNMYVRL